MGVNDDRSVTVRLKLSVRDYLTGGAEADAMNRRLQKSQSELGKQSDVTAGKLTGLAKEAERSSQKMGRSLLYGAAGLAAIGGAGGAIKLLPPLLAAAGTGAAALPGMLGGAIDSAIVLKVGLAGVSDQLGAIYKAKDPFSRLGPNARNFLATAERIKPTILGLQGGLQNRVLQGTGADLNLLATKALPAVREQLGRLADDWADTFAELSLSLSDREVTDAFNTIAGGADRFFDLVNSRIRPTAHALAGIATDAQPVADAVGKALIGMLDRFDARVQEARRTGSLARFFEAGADAAREMAEIGGDVLQITTMIVSETAKQSQAVGGAAARLNAYIASGRAAEDIAGIVHTLTVAYDGLADTVGPLGGVLRDTFADPGTAASIQQMFSVLSAGSQVIATVLQLLLTLNDALGGLPLSAFAFAFAVGKIKTVVDLATVATEKGAAKVLAYGAAVESTAAASIKGSARMETYGAAVTAVGKKMPGFVSGVGKAAIALVALDAAHSVIASFRDDAVNVEGLATAVERLGKTGQVSGELTRDFGANLDDLGVQIGFVDAAQTNPLAKFTAALEKAIPLSGDLALLLGSPGTFAGSQENLDALDQSLTDYAKKTGDATEVQKVLTQVQDKTGYGWAQLRDVLPQATAELDAMSIATMQLQSGTLGQAERQKLLNAPLQETVTIGRSLVKLFDDLNATNIGFAEATSAAEEAVDNLYEGLKKNGLALNKSKTDFDTNIKKGRENQALAIAGAKAARDAGQARLDDHGTLEQGAGVYDQYIQRLRTTLALMGATPAQIDRLIGRYSQMPPTLEGVGTAANSLNDKLGKIPKGTKFVFNGDSIVDATGKALQLDLGIKGLPAGKTFHFDGKSLVDGKGKVYELKKAVQEVPPKKSIYFDAYTGQAIANVRTLDNVIGAVNSKSVTLTVRTNYSSARAAEHALGKASGGVVLRPAAAGLLQPEIAPAGTRYQWAEPETGGELFLPRRGINRRRGQDLLEVAADWYGGDFVPRAAGGVRLNAAASGLVNVAAAPAQARSTPLDFAEAYLRARDAVKALSVSLHDNGRAFSVSTTKGRENRSAVYAGVRAAQDAAKTKFDETGSVTLANRAYATYIARLRATLQQQKVNAGTIRGLLALAGRPQYDVATTARRPADSSLNIAYARAVLGVAGGIDDLRDKLSLNQPSISVRTEGGRDNLSNILGFLDTAAGAAQAAFDRTHNAKKATQLYGGYVGQLKSILKVAGYSPATIGSILSQYGHITLTPNARGGVYMASGGVSLGGPALYSSGDRPLYGFAEPGTGGEAFIPRNGNQARGRDLLDVAAGWYGGRFAPSGTSGGGGSYDYSTHLTVTPLSYNPTTTELLSHLRLMDVQARTGRRR